MSKSRLDQAHQASALMDRFCRLVFHLPLPEGAGVLDAATKPKYCLVCQLSLSVMQKKTCGTCQGVHACL